LSYCNRIPQQQHRSTDEQSLVVLTNHRLPYLRGPDQVQADHRVRGLRDVSRSATRCSEGRLRVELLQKESCTEYQRVLLSNFYSRHHRLSLLNTRFTTMAFLLALSLTLAVAYLSIYALLSHIPRLPTTSFKSVNRPCSLLSFLLNYCRSMVEIDTRFQLMRTSSH